MTKVVDCHGVSWHIVTVSGKVPVFGIRGISGDIPEETKRDPLLPIPRCTRRYNKRICMVVVCGATDRKPHFMCPPL